MVKNLLICCMTAAFVLGFARNTTAQDGGKRDPEKDAKEEREKVFGKPFEERVEESVDRGCDWLKKQQGIDPIDDKAVFGKFPEKPPLYSEGIPHRYLVGRTAFPIQALCKSGVFADDPVIVKAMEFLRKNYRESEILRDPREGVPEGSKVFFTKTYEDATLLNAVEAYYISIQEAKERGLENPAKRFTKDEDGKKIPIKRWGTEEKGAKKAKENRKKRPAIVLNKEDRKMCETAVKALTKTFRKAYGGGGWRYEPAGIGEVDHAIDVSATQYAMMGLLCASRLGITYDKKVLFDIYTFMRGQQDKTGPEVVRKEKDAEGKDIDKPEERKKDPARSTRAYVPSAKDKARGWGYARQAKHNDAAHQEADRSTYGSMTAAGICTLIMLREELENDPNHIKKWEPIAKECQQMMNDGMAWLVTNWTLAGNPARGTYRYYYYLYTIERVGMLGGIDYIGAYDWYFEGAERQLLPQQQPDGKWDPQMEVDPSDIYNTCYALLFLKRATESIDRPKPVFTGTDE